MVLSVARVVAIKCVLLIDTPRFGLLPTVLAAEPTATYRERVRPRLFFKVLNFFSLTSPL